MKKRLLTMALACITMAAMLPGAVHAQTTPTTTDAAPADAPAEEFKPSGKLWGYAFGDYGYKVHGDSASRKTVGSQYGAQGTDFGSFALRRVYLGYDYNVAKGITTQFLLAHESDGTLTSDSKRAFYLKLANVRWRFAKNTDLVVGSQETPGFPMLEEKIWGYRSIEKTVTDYRGIITSTDLGASIQGKLNDNGDYGYNFLFSNGSVATPEADVYKKLSFDVYAKFMDKALIIDLYGDYNLSQRQPIEKNKATAKVFVAYQSDPITVGVTVFEQVLSHGVTYTESGATSAVTKNEVIFGYSAFLKGQIKKDKLNFFARFDNFNPDNTYNNSRTYSAVSNYYTTMYKVPAPVVENFITLGLDWMPSKNVHFMPNVWVDTYMNPAKGVVGKNKSDNDIEARMTFFYIFGRDYPNLAAKVN